VINDIDGRARQAQALWEIGDRRFEAGEYAEAWRIYTEAHDQVTDCPRLHRQAHERLRRVSRLNGHRGEYLTDVILLALAPLGVFELIAVYFRSKVADAALCRRNQAAGR
jgi:hypothetical protein